MAEVLRFFVQYEAVLYFVLGLSGIIYLYRFWLAWQEVRVAVYGLEQEASRARLNQAAMVLFILLVVAASIFVMVTFVSTAMPVVLATPTLDLSAGSLFDPLETPQQTANVATATALPPVSIDPTDCVEDQIIITSPAAQDVLQGTIDIEGTADIPNFGFYKFEVARAEEELWLTIQAGRTVVKEGVLVENWDTSRLPAGDYVLQLLVTNSAGEELPPCRIPVRIELPQ